MAENLHQIWQSFKEGDESAFKKLYEIHAPQLFKFGLKISREQWLLKDVIQELFIELWDKRNRLSDPENIGNYLIISFRNKLYKKLKQQSKIEGFDSNSNEFIQDSAEVLWVLDEDENKAKSLLKEAIDQLSIRQKEAIHLKYFNGLSSKEISEILEMNVQSVSNILHRALTALKKKIKKNQF